MIEVYVKLIKRGIMKIEEVPAGSRAEVEARLAAGEQ